MSSLHISKNSSLDTHDFISTENNQPINGVKLLSPSGVPALFDAAFTGVCDGLAAGAIAAARCVE